MASLLETIEADALAIENALITHSLSIRVGDYTVSATDVGGAPVHLTIAQAVTGVIMALTAKAGSVQTGDTLITVVKNS